MYLSTKHFRTFQKTLISHERFVNLTGNFPHFVNIFETFRSRALTRLFIYLIICLSFKFLSLYYQTIQQLFETWVCIINPFINGKQILVTSASHQEKFLINCRNSSLVLFLDWKHQTNFLVWLHYPVGLSTSLVLVSFFSLPLVAILKIEICLEKRNDHHLSIFRVYFW